MAKYLLRAVLHEKSTEDDVPASAYTKLHAELAKAGFKRTISGGGKDYELPPAEYRKVTSSDYTASEVRKQARAAIDKANLGRTYSTLVVRYDEAAWNDLEEA